MTARSTLSRASISRAISNWWHGSDKTAPMPLVDRPRNHPVQRIDATTGALNRHGLLAVLEQIVADHPFGEEISVLVIDLDRLEAVNDSQDHQAGDHVLVTTMARLRRLIEPAGCVARLSGDEFGCFIRHERSSSVAVAMAKEILKAIAEPIEVDGAVVMVNAFIGIATAPSGALSPDRILTSAHLAMTWTKDRGHGFCVYEPGMDVGLGAHAQSAATPAVAARIASKSDDRSPPQPGLGIFPGRPGEIRVIAAR